MRHGRAFWQVVAFIAATWVAPPVGALILAFALGLYARLTWYSILAISVASGVLCYFLIRALVELANWLDRAPKLTISRLSSDSNVQVFVNSSVYTACLYRITVENQTPNSSAENVRVRCSVEGLPLPTFDLHEVHDNSPPFRRQRAVRYGEPIEFDLIAKRDQHYQLFLWRSDVGASQAYALSHVEHDAIQSRYLGDGFLLTVTIVADPPAKVHQSSYCYRVRLLPDSVLSVESSDANRVL